MPKTIFGTTEKSNFILNMKSETLQKLTAVMLMLCIIVPQIGNMFIAGMDGNSALLGTFLYVSGFGSILVFIIAMLKKEHVFKENPSYFMIIFMAVWAFASYYSVVITANTDFAGEFATELINTAMLGEYGRYEGLLSILAYFGIFILATTLKSKKTAVLLMDIAVGCGIVQGIIAILQHIPEFDFLTDFADMRETLALKDVMLSSGLSDSPIFYGSFLTIVTGIAFSGAVFSDNLIRARIYGGAVLLFWLTGLFTSSIVPIIGIGCVTIITAIAVMINKKKGGTKFEKGVIAENAAGRFLLLAVGMLIIFGVVLAVQGLYIRDRAIAYQDSFARLFITTGYMPDSTDSLYATGFEKSIHLIKENPIFGAGPDCMAKMLSLSEELVLNSLDKSYNEYLYAAATRGIPSAIAYIAFVVYVIVTSFKGIKNVTAEDWYRYSLCAAVTAYAVQACFSASSVTVTPLFWLFCGMVCAKKLRENKE